jgi:hypothetical protein
MVPHTMKIKHAILNRMPYSILIVAHYTSPHTGHTTIYVDKYISAYTPTRVGCTCFPGLDCGHGLPAVRTVDSRLSCGIIRRSGEGPLHKGESRWDMLMTETHVSNVDRLRSVWLCWPGRCKSFSQCQTPCWRGHTGNQVLLAWVLPYVSVSCV